MKKSVKFILALVLLGTAGMNLAIDANGNVNIEGAKVEAAQTTTAEEQKWKMESVDCVDENDEVYATADGCFDGTSKTCTPTSCPPLPTKTNPPQ
ncbi:hypothetical protein ACR780_07505 [Sphingobacterium faecium]|uniref:hypothetical protein n=1 Tax=Sphingobacterium faecium TaxID=34087 RepID=UPI003DA26FE0